MKTRFSLVLVLASIAVACGWNCKDKSVDVHFKNPREYTWSIDTISMSGNSINLGCVWGSSSSDVYVAGYSTLGTGRMWHFDGQSWQRVRLLNIEGGPFSNMGGIYSIVGFAPDDVFAFGYKNGGASGFMSFVIHYDGSRWTEMPVPAADFLMSAWGSAHNDIWACGNYATLIHFDGKQWSIRADDPTLSFTRLTGNSPSNVYLMGVRRKDPAKPDGFVVIQRFDGVTWTVVDSVSTNSLAPFFGIYDMALAGDALYTLDRGVFVKRLGTWNVELRTNQYLHGIWVTSLDNIVAVGDASLIYHFDGSGWSQISAPLDNIWVLEGVWSTDRSMFIVGNNIQGNSIVLRGK